MASGLGLAEGQTVGLKFLRATEVFLLLTPFLVLCQSPVATWPPTRGEVEAAIQAGWDMECGDAMPVLDRALHEPVADPELYKVRGHCRNIQSDYIGAIEDYDRAIALDPLDRWTHYARGMSRHNLQQYALAIEGYNRSIELDPTYGKAWEWRAYTLSILGDARGAAEDFTRAIDCGPENPRVFGDRAKAWVDLREFAKGRQDFEHALELEPSDVEARLGRTAIDWISGDEVRAIAGWNAMCQPGLLGQTYPRLWMFLARARVEGLEKARAELSAWLCSTSEPADWELRLVSFLLGESRDEVLVAVAREEERDRAGPPFFGDFVMCEAWFYVGARAELEGRTQDALTAYERALTVRARGKWEWEFALRAYRDLAQRQGLAADLGFELETSSSEGEAQAVVRTVEMSGLAYAAGLRVGMALQAVEGRAVSEADLVSILGCLRPGHVARIGVAPLPPLRESAELRLVTQAEH